MQFGIRRRSRVRFIGQHPAEQLLAAMTNRLAVEVLDRGAVARRIAYQIMLWHPQHIRLHPNLLVGGDDFLHGLAIVELILYPLERVEGRARVRRGILRLVQPHALDHQPRFVHAAGRQFPAPLLNVTLPYLETHLAGELPDINRADFCT